MLLTAIVFISVMQCELLSIRILQRHGDRNPYTNIPGLPEVYDVGMLTDIGMKQLQGIGNQFRQKYLSLPGFTDKFNSSKFFFYSTYTDRTKQSQFAFANGLFPPSTGPVDDDGQFVFDFGIQPIPQESVSKDNEFYMLASEYCPDAKKSYQTYWGSDEIKDFFDQRSSIIDRLLEQTNISVKGFDLINVLDYIYCLNQHGQQLPGGITQTQFIEYMTLFDELSAKYMPLKDDAFCNASTGFFMRKILSELKADQASDSGLATGNRIFSHYMAHDSSISSIFGCLGLEIKANPGYGAVVVIEAHSNTGIEQGQENSINEKKYNTSNKEIKLRFLADLNPKQDGEVNLSVFIPQKAGCVEEYCSLDVFSARWDQLLAAPTAEDWFYKHCGLEKKQSSIGLTVTAFILFAISVVLFTVAVILIIVILRKGQPNSYQTIQ